MARNKSITCTCEICGQVFFFRYGGHNRYCSLRCYTADSADRFWSKVDRTDTCWLWTGCISGSNHYGAFRYQGRMQPSHRVAWILKHGEIGDGLCVLHRCDNPPCVNPDHLFLGTQSDNMVDMVGKGRQGRQYGSAHGMSKLTERDVVAIRADSRIQREIAADFRVDPSLIRLINLRKIWSHV